MNARWILWKAMCGLLAFGGQAAAQDLGDGRGIAPAARRCATTTTPWPCWSRMAWSGRRFRGGARGWGILGMSVKVAEFQTVHALVSGNTGLIWRDRARSRLPDPRFLIKMVE